MKKFISVLISFIILTVSAIAVYAETKMSDMYFKITELYLNEQYEECIDSCKNALAVDEFYMEAYYFMSMSAYKTGNYELAYQTLKNQIEKNPNNELALYNLACTSSILKKEDCVEYVKRLLTIDITNKSSIKSDSDFDNIRNNEKYKQLMEISVVVGGELVEFDVAPIIIDGRTLLPVRKIFECLGAEVTYDEINRIVFAEKDNVSIEIGIDNKIAKVNGEEKELDVPAMILDGRTLVPVRFVSEALEAEVEWDGENEVVNIIIPMVHGTEKLEEVKTILDEKVIVSVVDGIFPEPYTIKSTEGCTMLIFENIESLEVFSKLSMEDKLEYMRSVVYDNYALVVGCSPVYTKIVYNGKVYYEGNYDYDDNAVSELKYYSKGKIENIVKQYKSTLNYKDFYLLPKSEQTTSKIGD